MESFAFSFSSWALRNGWFILRGFLSIGIVWGKVTAKGGFPGSHRGQLSLDERQAEGTDSIRRGGPLISLLGRTR